MPTDEDGDVIMTDPSEAAAAEVSGAVGGADAAMEGEAGAEAAAPPAEEGPSTEERVLGAEAAKEEGNGLLKAGDPRAAVAKYADGVVLVEPLLEKAPSEVGEDLQRRATVAYQALRLNSAQACLKSSDWLAATEHADKVLVIDKDNTKALYRRGLAASNMNTEGRLDQARADFMRVATLDPSNREVRDQLAKVKERLKDFRAEEKQRLQQAMSGGLYKDHHNKLDKQRSAYQAEVFRRKEAEEEEISFEDWVKKEKEKDEEAKKKEKEELDKQRTAEQEQQVRAQFEQAMVIRRGAGEGELDFEAWKVLEEAKEQERKRALIGGVVRTDDTELDAEEKKLLEETKSKGYYHGRLNTVLSANAPQPQQVQGAAANAENGQVGSEWNQAGTWEEKDQTAWAKDRLKELLAQARVSSQAALPSGLGVVATAKVTKVKSLNGDAQLVCVRKQAKHGYNFEGELSFSITFKPDVGSEVDTGETFSGYINLPELIDSVPTPELRIEARWKGSGPSADLQGLSVQWLDKLRMCVRSQVDAFRQEYQQRR